MTEPTATVPDDSKVTEEPTESRSRSSTSLSAISKGELRDAYRLLDSRYQESLSRERQLQQQIQDTKEQSLSRERQLRQQIQGTKEHLGREIADLRVELARRQNTCCIIM